MVLFIFHSSFSFRNLYINSTNSTNNNNAQQRQVQQQAFPQITQTSRIHASQILHIGSYRENPSYDKHSPYTKTTVQSPSPRLLSRFDHRFHSILYIVLRPFSLQHPQRSFPCGNLFSVGRNVHSNVCHE